MDYEKFREMFLEEASDHLRLMVDQLLKLDSDPHDGEAIDSLFREAHSIKGMAATMEFHETAKLAHHLEDRLDHCRRMKAILKPEIDFCLEATDLFELLLDDIRCGKPERSVDGFLQTPVADGAAKEGTPGPDHEGSVTLKLVLKATTAAAEVRYMVILRFLEKLGTIVETEPGQNELAQAVENGSLLVRLETELSRSELQEQLKSFSELEEIGFQAAAREAETVAKQPSSQTLRINTDLLDHFINLTGELITNRYQLENAAKGRNWSGVDEGLSRLTRLVKGLHHQVLQVRMVALQSLSSRLARTLHDLCRSSGKEVGLKLEGMELEMDRAIVEGLVDPLGHMVRNAVDHGIVDKGEIRIRAWRERDQVMLQFADDGVGLNPDKIRDKALERGLLTQAQAAAIREFDLFQLICQPGFSTAEAVTEISGRGVGMDVVKTEVEKLGGILLIDSKAGEGTRITLKLPLSLAIIKALLVECAGMTLALPLTRVVQTLELSPEQIQSSGKQLLIRHQGENLPLLSLRKILKQAKAQTQGLVPVVITDILGRRVGLVVDRLDRQQEIFVQRLPAPFDRVPGCAGGTILGDGRIIFLLDLQSLLEKRKA